jgi:hypothetical protein
LVISSKTIGIAGGLSIVLASCINYFGLHNPEKGAISYITYGIFTFAIVYALFLHKKTGNTSIKSFFNEGFKCFVIMVLFISIYTFVFYKLNPQIIENEMLAINAVNATDKNKTPAEVIANGKNFKDIFIPMTVGMTTIFHLVIGALVSLIGGAILSQSNNKS